MSLLPFGFYDMLDQLAEPGCAICALVRRDVDKLLDSILHEQVTDPLTQESFRASRGLCAEHSARFCEYRHVLGIAVLVEQVVDEVLEILERTPARAGRSGSRLRTGARESTLARQLAPLRPCIVCEAQAYGERNYARALAVHLNDARMDEAFRLSDGVCLPHFVLTLNQVEDPDLAQRLADVQKGIWQRLQAELEEFMRKSDAGRSKGEMMDHEGDSWRRAMQLMGGERRVLGLNRKAGPGSS
jgi:hypothetical protein